MLLECGDDNESQGNLSYEFPFSSIDDFMDRIEHFLACKSVAVPTCNSYSFYNMLHQNHCGSSPASSRILRKGNKILVMVRLNYGPVVCPNPVLCILDWRALHCNWTH